MKQMLLFFIINMFILSVNAVSQTSDKLVEGTDYTLLTTMVAKTPEPQGKINVKEFFSFTCIHCKDTESLVEKELANNKRIDLQKIQVLWDGQSDALSLAKINATIQLLGFNNLYMPVFEAIFANQNLTDTNVLKRFLMQNGLTSVASKQFMDTYGSFTVMTKIGEYRTMTSSYAINATPTFIVADKYVVSPAQPERLIVVTKSLVDKSIKENATKAKVVK